MFQLHPSTPLIPPGADQAADIDNEMVPLIQALWASGWQTLACCQDQGEAVEAERKRGQRGETSGHQGFIAYHKGWAWLKMPTADALNLLAELRDHEAFGPRIKIRWQKESWRMHTPVIYQDDRFTAAPYVQIYFPKDQINELTGNLAKNEPLPPGQATVPSRAGIMTEQKPSPAC